MSRIYTRMFGICVLVVTFGATGALAVEGGFPFRYRIAYSTYLGGPEWEEAREVIVDPDGAALIGAQVKSPGLPVTPGAFQPQYAGDDPRLGHGGIYGGDCYLMKLSADGTQVLAATYFGGSKQERNVYGMALDKQGNVVITTLTRSADAPTTPGAFQRKYGGGPADILVAKLSGDLKRLLWCTYVGGTSDESPRGGLTLNDRDEVYVVGTTNSRDFPVTPGVLQPQLNGPRDSVVLRLRADGSGLVFSTFFGGSGEDDAAMGIRLDAEGNLYFAGHCRSSDFPVTPGAPQPRLGGQSDCYLAKLSHDASRLIFATYLGGSGNEFAEHCPWLTPDGCIILSGFCGSADFPTTSGALQRTLKGPGDGFLTKISADGKAWVFSTLFGGSGGENSLMPTVDAEGRIWLVGSTGSRDFPVTSDALQTKFGGGEQDGFVAVFSGDGAKLLYATYLGGRGNDLVRGLAFGPHGEVYLVGTTSSPDWPVTSGAIQRNLGGGDDAFVVKLVPAG